MSANNESSRANAPAGANPTTGPSTNIAAKNSGASASAQNPDELPIASGESFVVRIGDGGLFEALEELDKAVKTPTNGQDSYQRRLQTRKMHLISKKTPISWIGREITLGEIGLINHGGLPKILMKPGRYPSFPLGNWWARSLEDRKKGPSRVLSPSLLRTLMLLPLQFPTLSSSSTG